MHPNKPLRDFEITNFDKKITTVLDLVKVYSFAFNHFPFETI
jgi:hypothetical protein